MKRFLLILLLYLPGLTLNTQTITWTGAGDGYDWYDPSNWDYLAVPTKDNHVIIPDGSTVLINNHVETKSITVQGNSMMTLNDGISFSLPSMFGEGVIINWNLGRITGGYWASFGASLTNKGTININRPFPSFNAPQFYGSTFNNEGVVNLIQGYLILVDSVVNNQPTGVINVQSDETGIGCGINGCGTFNNYGTIKGNGTFYVNNEYLNYTNTGNFEPGTSPGILTFIGNFSSSTSSTLAVDLEGLLQGIEYDLLAINGNAQFYGNVEITMGFEANVNDEFVVATTAGNITACGVATQASAVFEGNLYDFDIACRNNNELVLTITDKLLGVTSYELDPQNIQLYPNPTRSQFTIRNNSNYHLDSAIIVDINGRIIKDIDLSEAKNDIVVSLRGFPSGIYLVKLNAENKSVVKKLMKL